jgi:hypothetical protein
MASGQRLRHRRSLDTDATGFVAMPAANDCAEDYRASLVHKLSVAPENMYTSFVFSAFVMRRTCAT